MPHGLRPPFALGRFERLPSGRIAYRMKRPAPDGATHRVMTPVELVGVLASLVPPPRAHLVRYHGAFAPHARDRLAVVPPYLFDETAPKRSQERRRAYRLPWGELLKKVFAHDVFTCSRCGRRRRVLAAMTDPPTVRRILEHLGLPARAPPTAPARPARQLFVGLEHDADDL